MGAAGGFGMLSPYDDSSSSDDEDGVDGPHGGYFDGGVEDDDGQVEDEVPSYQTQWFLVNLDRFMASKGGEQHKGVDGDMLSALDLGGVESEV